jgi:hypothetical protein
MTKKLPRHMVGYASELFPDKKTFNGKVYTCYHADLTMGQHGAKARAGILRRDNPNLLARIHHLQWMDSDHRWRTAYAVYCREKK